MKRCLAVYSADAPIREGTKFPAPKELCSFGFAGADATTYESRNSAQREVKVTT